MSVRQYIGARYVPIFFDNNGSTDWVENHIYEPLTIVTYLGNSYTSKKLVPSSVGNPASNSEYWASTGIYNSQVEQYRQEVQALDTQVNGTGGIADDVEELQTAVLTDNTGLVDKMSAAESDIDDLEADVNTLKNRKVIFIGDSYGTGSGGGYSVTPWTTLAGNFLGLTNEVSFWNYSRGGASFGYNDGAESSPSTGQNFCDLIRKAANELSSSVRNTITDIVIGGAINDWSHTAVQIQTGMANFKAIANAQFPNAKITFCNICSTLVFEYKAKYFHDAFEIIMNRCGINNFKFKRCDIDLLNNAAYFNADGVHPTQDGQYAIARRVCVAINDGDPNESTTLRVIDGDYFDGTSRCDGSNYILNFTQTSKNFGSATTIDSTWRKIDEFDVTSFTGYDTNGGSSVIKWQFAMPCCIKSGGDWYNGVLLLVEFRQSSSDIHKCEIWCRQVGHFTSGAFTSFSATSILPSATSVVIPIWAI